MLARPLVGVVEDVRPIRGADRVRRAVVRGGGGTRHSIVFGGRDVVVTGSLVPVALPGCVAIDAGSGRPRKVRPRRYLGVLSSGMLCSSVELGWAREGPDEVPVLRRGFPGDRLPEAGDLRDWLSDDSYRRHVEHFSSERRDVSSTAWRATGTDLGPPTAPLSVAELASFTPATPVVGWWPWREARRGLAGML